MLKVAKASTVNYMRAFSQKKFAKVIVTAIEDRRDVMIWNIIIALSL